MARVIAERATGREPPIVADPIRASLTGPDHARAAALVSGQWPKVCKCGVLYFRTGGHRHLWADLPLAYQRTDGYATAEARHCHCGSTLEILLAVHDPDFDTRPTTD